MAEDDFSSTGGLGDLFSQLQAARADLEAQADAIDETVVEGSAAGGAVVIRLRGSLEAEHVHIDPSIVDPSDPALLEDAVLAALRDGLGRLVELRNSLPAPDGIPTAGGIDLGSLVGNLDLGGLLGGVDLEAMMGNLGMGLDLAALSGLGALGGDDDPDEDEYDDSAGVLGDAEDPDEDEDDGSDEVGRDDEPGA